MAKKTKFGTVTALGPNFGVILSADGKYLFSMSSYPQADMGCSVTFQEDSAYSTNNTKYAKTITVMQVTDYVMKDILQRLERIEARLAEPNILDSCSKVGDNGY